MMTQRTHTEEIWQDNRCNAFQCTQKPHSQNYDWELGIYGHAEAAELVEVDSSILSSSQPL